MASQNPLTYIRCSSHRARHQVLGILGPRTCWVSYRRNVGKGCYLVTSQEYQQLRLIKGVTRLRKTDDLVKAWTW